MLIGISKRILQLFPLDRHAERSLALMKVDPGDPVETPIWDRFRDIVATSAGEESEQPFEQMERQPFYDRVKRAYAVVATGESALYANLILRKGVARLIPDVIRTPTNL